MLEAQLSAGGKGEFSQFNRRDRVLSQVVAETKWPIAKETRAKRAQKNSNNL